MELIELILRVSVDRFIASHSTASPCVHLALTTKEKSRKRELKKVGSILGFTQIQITFREEKFPCHD